MKHYTIQQLYDLGIISGRLLRFFEKRGFPTSKEILEYDDKYQGNWSVLNEKGTPVKEGVKRIREFIYSQVEIVDNSVTLACFLAIEVSSNSTVYRGRYKEAVDAINNYILHTKSQKRGTEILENKVREFGRNNPNQKGLMDKLEQLVLFYKEELIKYKNISIETLIQFNKLIPELNWKDRQDRINYLHCLSDNNPFAVIYSIMEKHYSIEDWVLLENRLLFRGSGKLIAYNDLERQGTTKSGALRVRAFRLAKAFPDFLAKLNDTGILKREQFTTDQLGKFITVFPGDKDLFENSNFRSNFIDYAIEVLYPNWKSINKILNNDKIEKRIIEDGSYFFNTMNIDSEYVVKKLERISKLFYNENNAGVALSREKVSENELLGTIAKQLFQDYKPELLNNPLMLKIEIREILPSLASAILNLFMEENKKRNMEMGNNSWAATAEDIQQELLKYPEYEHLKSRTLEQIRGSMETLREIKSISKRKYRLITSLVYGYGNTITIPFRIFTESNCLMKLTLKELWERMVHGGYEWDEKSIESQLFENKEYFQKRDGKWGCSELAIENLKKSGQIML